MSDVPPLRDVVTQQYLRSAEGGRPKDRDDQPMVCERCGAAEMYRMHAVWRCPACGFKTDCCGW